MIKVIAIIDNMLGSGGGFDQAISSVAQMNRLSANRFVFEVATTHNQNIKILKEIGFEPRFIRFKLVDKIILLIVQSKIFELLLSKYKILSKFEKKLLEWDCDVVYFATPSNLSRILFKLNYIFTLWDLSHLETPEFPEVRDFNAFHRREELFKNCMGPALLTLTDSKKLVEIALSAYGIDRGRLLAMPFSASQFLLHEKSTDKHVVLEKYGITEGYYYYPAQFWAHKNHIRILQAIKILRDERSVNINVVFSGKDYGTRPIIEKFILDNNLASQVKILGFVPSEEIRGLYQGSSSVVMPTYFGPTNLPPLEAWMLGVPLIYSINLGEQVQDAAILIDPNNANDLADAILQSKVESVRERLISAGKRRLREIDDERIISESKLCEALHKFEAMRETWHKK